ncbi:MAG: ureidoglycolate lyase [Cyanobacteriota bacterium]
MGHCRCAALSRQFWVSRAEYGNNPISGGAGGRNTSFQEKERVTSQLRQLKANLIEAENFAPFGQVISPTPAHKPFDDQDAQLSLNQGQPRFYIMRLPRCGLKFSQITHHTHCTQCLGSLNGKEWFIAVAPPADELHVDQIQAFRVPGDRFIKLEMGTWHAGPCFDHEEFIDFYNLELSDTNITDHETVNLLQTYNLEFQITP